MYTKNWLVIFAFFCFMSLRVASQGFYVNSGNIFQKVNITATGCVTTNVTNCAGSPLSIAVYKNTLYYSAGASLSSAVISNNAMSGCKDILNVPGSNSLTVNKQGILYMAGGTQLYRVDPTIPSVVLVGNMPYTAAGDLVFYNDTLYMASNSGIVKVDTDNPSLSTIQVPYGGKIIYGLATVSYDCRSNKVYALAIGAGFTEVIEVDMENGKFLNTVCTLPYVVLDAASEVEDGTLFGIRINSLKVQPSCTESNKATVTIQTEPGLAVQTFTMDNTVSNSTGLFENVGPGIHPIQITTPGGCVKDTSVNVPSHDIRKPAIQPFFEDPTCRQEGKVWFVVNDTPGLYTVSLNNNTFISNHTFSLLEGAYHFRLQDLYDCPLDSFDISLAPPKGCDTIYFPNAFTPAKASNNIFRSSPNVTLKNYQLSIYSRWGQLLFTTNEISKGWNGTLNGQLLPSGAYVFIARYASRDGKVRTHRGSVLLIR
jgi:gliding motility-associated-like protein